MNHIGYKNLLLQYIDSYEPDQPIPTAQITQYVATETGLDEADIKKTVNVNMARLEKAGRIMRIEKGIYCKKTQTAFGYYMPSKETLFCRQLLYDEDEVIGYETGLSALNRLGFTSQMPKRKCIATNRYTKRVPADILVEIRKPSANVNRTNYRYLQILDAIRDLEHAPVDTTKPEYLLREMVKKSELDTDVLIFMARKFYNAEILLKTIDIMLGGLYEAAQG